MLDGSVGRNESPEKIKFLFWSNNRVLVLTQDAPLKQIANLSSFRPTLKTAKTGVDKMDKIMDKKIE